MVLQRLSASAVIEVLLQVLTLFPARIRGNRRFAASIWADGARVFGRALPDIRILPGKIRRSNNYLNPEHLPDEQWLFHLLRASGRTANFFATSQLQRNSELVCFGLLADVSTLLVLDVPGESKLPFRPSQPYRD